MLNKKGECPTTRHISKSDYKRRGLQNQLHNFSLYNVMKRMDDRIPTLQCFLSEVYRRIGAAKNASYRHCVITTRKPAESLDCEPLRIWANPCHRYQNTMAHLINTSETFKVPAGPRWCRIRNHIICWWVQITTIVYSRGPQRLPNHNVLALII